MAANPDPARITDELWYLWERLHELEPKSKLGGIYTFKPGYHSTRNDNKSNWPGNYSITDTEDKGGPSDKAAAIDWTFPDAQAADYDTIMKYSKRLLDSGKDRNDDRLDGWREFYGQADADTAVEGWDFRYVRPATSDPSHLWHIHLSCDRDKVTSKANMDKLLSVLRGDDVALTDAEIEKIAKKVWSLDAVGGPEAPKPPHEDPDYADNKTWAAKSYLRRTYEATDQGLINDEVTSAALADLETKVDQILAALAAAGLTGATLKFEGTATTVTAVTPPPTP